MSKKFLMHKYYSQTNSNYLRIMKKYIIVDFWFDFLFQTMQCHNASEVSLKVQIIILWRIKDAYIDTFSNVISNCLKTHIRMASSPVQSSTGQRSRSRYMFFP